MMQNKIIKRGYSSIHFIGKVKNGLLFLLLMNSCGFAQTISSDTIKSKYKICFEGKFKNAKIEIYANDSLCYSGSISNKNSDIVELAECVDLFYIPQTIKIIINHIKVIYFTCNAEKPFLYCKRKWFWYYSISDRSKQKWYR